MQAASCIFSELLYKMGLAVITEVLGHCIVRSITKFQSCKHDKYIHFFYWQKNIRETV